MNNRVVHFEIQAEQPERAIKFYDAVAMPKFALVGVAWQGYFVDPEGNTFGIHQPDADASLPLAVDKTQG